MKRYTEDNFTFDSLFDVIRFIFSSVFLAPIRLVNEITKKIPYASKDCLGKVSITSILINLLLIVINIGLQLYHNKFSFLSGSVPLISLIGSLILLISFNFALQKFGFIQMKLKEDEVPSEEKKEEQEEEITDIDYGINKTVSRPQVSLSDDNLINDDTLEDINKVNLSNDTDSKIGLDDEYEFETFGENSIDFNDVFKEADFKVKEDDLGNQRKYKKEFEEVIEQDKYGLSELDDGKDLDCSANIEDIESIDLDGILDDIIGDD